MRFSLLSLCFSCQLVAARLLDLLPEDTYTFPKYRVTFLNGLPVLNETAQRWLANGLRGGEREFLEQQPWMDTWQVPPTPKEIESGDDRTASQRPFPKLERMKMGPRDTYLCLIPSPLDSPPPPPPEDPHAETTPAHSWSLLQPLSGTCLYHRQGWFTYSYCHNEQIRQFRELPHSHPHPSGYKPEEDPDWESYTLGRAPSVPEPGADLSVAEQSAIAANLELARGAGSRYLVQRWGDGTLCDKTGRRREVEVQFHCSMTMTDTILWVKEAKTCSYVLVIHTPRLCGEPGFKSRQEAREEASIQCREIVDSIANQQSDLGNLPPADHPHKLHPRKGNLAPPDAKHGGAVTEDKQQHTDKATYDNIVRRALEAIIGHGGNLAGVDSQVIVNDNGDLVIEFLDEVSTHDGLDGGDAADRRGSNDAVVEALRKAGYDVQEKKPLKTDNKNSKQPRQEGKQVPKKAGGQTVDPPQRRDEL